VWYGVGKAIMVEFDHLHQNLENTFLHQASTVVAINTECSTLNGGKWNIVYMVLGRGPMGWLTGELCFAMKL